MKTRIKGWAVMNADLDTPCVELLPGNLASASAVYFSDIPGQAKRLAKMYIERNIPDGASRKFIRLRPVELAFTSGLSKQ